MAVSKTWRGEGACALMGTDAHRLRYAQRNLASTEKVLIGAANGVNKSIAALQSHQQILQASLVRMRAATFQVPNWMSSEETTAKLEAQLQLISKALSSATKLQGQLMYKSVDIVGPFGSDKDYTQPQIDELTTATLETYVQQLATIDKLPADHPPGWWDAADPATWIPHGWKPKDTQKWCRYARMATEEGHGLVPYYGIPHSQIGWDPTDPLTWVPFGWHIKDPSLWKDWHESQRGDEDDESPHAGLLAPDADWNRVEAASIAETNSVDPNKDMECTFEEAYGIGGQKAKRITQGKFAAESSKSQPQPLSPFGDGDYPAYYDEQKKRSAAANSRDAAAWAEFERHQWGR